MEPESHIEVDPVEPPASPPRSLNVESFLPPSNHRNVNPLSNPSTLTRTPQANPPHVNPLLANSNLQRFDPANSNAMQPSIRPRNALQPRIQVPGTNPTPTDSTHPNPLHANTNAQRLIPLNPNAVPTAGTRDAPRPWSAVEAAYIHHPEYQAQMYIKKTIEYVPPPQPIPPSQAQLIRRDCERYLSIIRALEAEKDRIAPRVDVGLERRLIQTRLDRSIIFFRVFRINDLPPEIISNIFRYVVWSATRPALGVLWRLRLTWACRHWRTIAIADSTLWNAIWFRDPPPYERSLTWFERAGTAPLDLRINERDPAWRGEDDDHKFTREQMENLLDRLFTKLSQIRMLIIVVDNWPPALTVLDKLRKAGNDRIPLSIERFELHRVGTPYVWIGPGYEPNSHRIPMALFGGAPAALTYFCVNGVHVDWHKSILTNLTTIDIRRIPLELSPRLLHFRNILKGCPRLQKLSLDGAGPIWEPEEANGLEPVRLPHLRTLVVGDWSLQYGMYVFSQLSALHVRDFAMMNMTGEDYSPMFALITSHFPEVRLLTIYSVEVVNSPRGKRTMVKWLESMPLLSYLRIANVKRDLLETFLHNPRQYDLDTPFTPTHNHSAPATYSRQILCPKLDILECQAVDPDLIATWGRARKNIGAPLRKIYITKDMANKMAREQHTTLRVLCDLYIVEHGTKTPEEDEVLR